MLCEVIINHLVKQGIGKLIIGNNPGWKQSVSYRKQVNQSFTSIPHSRLIEMLTYKAKLLGIEVIVREESYTSVASFLSLDPIPNYGDKNAKQVKFSGYRESRGIYKQRGAKTRINADVQASAEAIASSRVSDACLLRKLHLLRKAMKCGLGGFPHEQLHQEEIPGIFTKRGIEGCVVRPVRLTPSRN